MKRLFFVALVASASIIACDTPDSTTVNDDTTPVTTDTMMNNATDTSTITTDTTGMGGVPDTTGSGR